MQKIAVTPIFTGVTAILLSSNCQRRDCTSFYTQYSIPEIFLQFPEGVISLK